MGLGAFPCDSHMVAGSILSLTSILSKKSSMVTMGGL